MQNRFFVWLMIQQMYTLCINSFTEYHVNPCVFFWYHVFVYQCFRVYFILVYLQPCLFVSLYSFILVFFYPCILLSLYICILVYLYPCILLSVYPCILESMWIHVFMYQGLYASIHFVSLYPCFLYLLFPVSMHSIVYFYPVTFIFYIHKSMLPCIQVNFINFVSVSIFDCVL